MPLDDEGKIVLPTEIMKEFEPWMLDVMLEASRNGGTKNEIMLVTGLPKRLFNSFLVESNENYNQDFDEAFNMALMISQAYWENLGRGASAGKLNGHKSGTYLFMMKNNFKKDYRDEQVHKHESETLPAISEDLDPVEAGKKYKELLLESSLGDFFD